MNNALIATSLHRSLIILIAFSDAENFHHYGHLDIPLDRLSSQKPWIAGFYSSCGPVQYTLKAWCSRMNTSL